IVEQRERRSKGFYAEFFGRESFGQSFVCRLKIYTAQTVAISFHPDRRRTKCRGRGGTLYLSGCLEFTPMCGNFLPVVMQFLRVCRVNNRQHRFPANSRRKTSASEPVCAQSPGHISLPDQRASRGQRRLVARG